MKEIVVTGLEIADFIIAKDQRTAFSCGSRLEFIWQAISAAPVPPVEAYDLVQKNLVSASFDQVDVTVTEAVYDGKYLRIVHSTKERDAQAPFDDEKVYGGLQF